MADETNSNDNRIRFLKTNVLLALLATFLIALKLWHCNRYFPTAPILYKIFPSIPAQLNYVILGALLISLVIALFTKKPFFFLTIVLIASGILILLDITRLQPEFYMFFSFIFLLALYYKNIITENTLLNTARIMVCGIYFSSGISKLNPYFDQVTYQWMIYPLRNLLYPDVFHFIQKCHALVPLSEIVVAIALLLPKLKNIALVFVCFIHLYILLLLSLIVYGFNYIVIPWNISMILLVFILFYKSNEVTFNFLLQEAKQTVFKVFVLLYFIVPVLYLLGIGDMYLSFALYTGRFKYAYIYITDDVYERLPFPIKKLAVKKSKEQYYKINLNDWAYSEMGAPIYPEKRALKQYKQYFEPYANNRNDVFILWNIDNHDETIY